MRRIAFIGIENADSEVLHGALRKNLGSDAEIRAFEKDVNAVKVAPFLVAKNKETGQLEGSDSVAFISDSADQELAKRIGRLERAGVSVRQGWSDFSPEATESEIFHWLGTGSWPEPEAPEADEEDDDAALLALLDDDDDYADTAVPSSSAPESPSDLTPERLAPVTTEEEDDLPLPNAPEAFSEQEETYPTRRFDSMGANDGFASSRRTADSFGPVPELIDEDDDDLPLPSFAAPQQEEKIVEPSFEPAPSSDEEDDFNSAFNDDDDVPTFTVGGFDDSSQDDGDDDLELPVWTPPQVEEVRHSEPVAPSRPRSYERAPEVEDFAPEDTSFSDEEDSLPMFGGFTEEEAPVTRSSRRSTQREEITPEPVFSPADAAEDNYEDDFELPMFTSEDSSSHQDAPRISDVDQEDEPQDEFSVDDDADELPAFDLSEEPAPVPSRRSRRDFLQAAEALSREKTVEEPAPSDSVDEEEDLPVFAPQFTPVSIDDEEDLPAPVRRRALPKMDDDGDELPEFVGRGQKENVESSPEGETVEDEEDDVPEFSFAPKSLTPRYAAPPEQQPDWGTPIQKPVRDEEPVRRPVQKPVEKKPVQRVAPEEVRYQDDIPAEVIAEKARARRNSEGYRQPVIETDVPNRELKPAPGSADIRKATQQRVVNQRPAAPAREESLDFLAGPPDTGNDFDPDAPAPFMADLNTEQRRAQSTMEKIRRDYDSDSILKVRSKNSAVCYYVTGSHGGAGKTTTTWMMANTVAAALKKDPSRPVFLIEGDYENSKLAQRLNLPPEKNSGKLAEFYRRLSSDRSLMSKQKINMVDMTEKIIKESIHVNDQGVHIIAAPYDLTKREGRFLRIAIQKSVEYAERQGGYVFIDADTLSNDDILDRTLAAKATHVILVSFGDQDHVDDTNRAIHTLTTPLVKAVSNSSSTNGMGVPKDRIKLFFNKTGSERFEDLQRIMRPYLTEGHLPTVQGLNDGGWIGNLTGGDFMNAVTSYAAFVNRVSPMPELLSYQQRRPAKSTQRSGFMKMFGGRRS